MESSRLQPGLGGAQLLDIAQDLVNSLGNGLEDRVISPVGFLQNVVVTCASRIQPPEGAYNGGQGALNQVGGIVNCADNFGTCSARILRNACQVG